MIKVTGDLFDGSHKVIGHGVNTHGVMGAGIAKLFRETFPQQYKAYRVLCVKGELKPGGVHIWHENGVSGFNIASQDAPGANATYEWLSAGLYEAAEIAIDTGFDTIAIPEIGCGIGGLTRADLNKAIARVEDDYAPFEFTVVSLPKKT